MNSSHSFHLKKVLIIAVAACIYGCQTSDSKIEKKTEASKKKVTHKQNELAKKIEEPIKPDTLEQSIIDAGLIDVQSIAPNILVNLKYATVDNFMSQNLYGSLKKAYLQPDVAASLLESQIFLQSIDSSLTLLIYDAVRPRSVQQFMWDYLDMPISEKIKFVSNPKNGSIHNYGSAVDLTIARLNGTPLDMGAKYDEIEKIAYPKLENHFLKTGEISQQQIENRKLLRKVMKHGKFTGISTEWWHFNRYPRAKAKSLFKIIE
ncbi:MAG: M15 family metallopeptidase [Crocinitomicaceae bacterium]